MHGYFFGGHGFHCGYEGHYLLPGIVTDFASDYLTPLSPKRLLNPWTTEPVAVSTLLNRLPSLQEATAVTRTAQTVWQAQLFSQMAQSIFGWNKPLLGE